MTTTRSTNRRQFLRTAAVAGAVPFILPGSIWAADTAPNSRINLGFVGVGKQGIGLLHAMLPRNDVRVLAVCDVDNTRREMAKQAVEREYQPSATGSDCAAYNDFHELFARKDIDAVVIATPNHWHALMAVAAANAGKDIYCDKPRRTPFT